MEIVSADLRLVDGRIRLLHDGKYYAWEHNFGGYMTKATKWIRSAEPDEVYTGPPVVWRGQEE